MTPESFTVTVADWLAVPPLPVQVSVNVLLALVKLLVLVLPESDLLPDQAPEATHEVAFVDDQIRVVGLPLVTAVGIALIETVGAGVITGVAVTTTD